MTSNIQMELGILASVITGTISTILGGIILQWFVPSSSASQSDKPPAIEYKSAPEQPVPPKGEECEVELRKRALPSPAWERENALLRDQLAAQKEEMEQLKRTVNDLKRQPVRREVSEWNRPSPVAAPQPAAVLVYYRVAAQRTRQIEYDRIDEVKHLLKSMNLSYVCGQPWKDSGLSPLRVSIAIHRAGSWRCYRTRDTFQQLRIMSNLVALGIEAKSEKPKEIDE